MAVLEPSSSCLLLVPVGRAIRNSTSCFLFQRFDAQDSKLPETRTLTKAGQIGRPPRPQPPGKWTQTIGPGDLAFTLIKFEPVIQYR